MADACMPEKFYELAQPMLPAEKQPGPEGGRRPIGHSRVLKVICFVLVTDCRWKDVPKEMGCCGETARTRLQAWECERRCKKPAPGRSKKPAPEVVRVC